MPNHIQKKQSELKPAHKATIKYRRLQTLIKKTVEVSQLCGISLNLLVYDKKFNRITEYHTDDTVKIESIQKELSLDNTLNKGCSMKIKSVNATIKFQVDKNTTNGSQIVDVICQSEKSSNCPRYSSKKKPFTSSSD